MNDLKNFSDWSFQSTIKDFHKIENILSNYVSYEVTKDNNDFKNFMYYFMNQITILHKSQFVSLWNEEKEENNNYENEIFSINKVLKVLNGMDQNDIMNLYKSYKKDYKNKVF